MAGGDLNVNVRAPGSIGVGQFNAKIDANSTASGNMTEKVNVNGKDVFMTPEGKALYEKKMQLGEGISSATVEQDPGFFSLARWFGSSESAVGKP